VASKLALNPGLGFQVWVSWFPISDQSTGPRDTQTHLTEKLDHAYKPGMHHLNLFGFVPSGPQPARTFVGWSV
jgi:hypothetical protein